MRKKLLLFLFFMCLAYPAYAQIGAATFALSVTDDTTTVNNPWRIGFGTGFSVAESGGIALITNTAEGAGGGTGDIESVGDCTTGACFDANGTGTTLHLEGSTANTSEQIISTIDPTADRTFNFPNDEMVAGDVLVASDTSDLEYLNLTTTQILIGDGSGVPTAAALSAHASMTNAGAVTIVDWALTADADAGDFDLDSLDRLEFVDAGIFIDGGTDAVMLISTDGTLEIATNDWDISTTGVQTNMGAITSDGVVTSTGFTIGSAAIIEAELEIIDGGTLTTTELNNVDGATSATATTLVDADRVVVNDASVMKQVDLTDFEVYFESALDTLSNVTTVGALNSGTITSGFGAIDNGTSNIRTATFTAETAYSPDASGGADLGTAALEFNDLFLNDGGVIQLGDDQDVTITHVADVGVTINLDVTISGADLTLGATGMKLTGSDGDITFLGLGDGTDEDLTINLDDTTNEATFSSSTGVVLVNFVSMAGKFGGTKTQIISIGTAPAVSSCGTTPSISATSTDIGGKVTIGSSASSTCTVTFDTAYTNAPSCIVTGDTIAVFATTSTTVLTITDGAGDFSYKIISALLFVPACTLTERSVIYRTLPSGTLQKPLLASPVP